jgi:hypothetical protein
MINANERARTQPPQAPYIAAWQRILGFDLPQHPTSTLQ